MTSANREPHDHGTHGVPDHPEPQPGDRTAHEMPGAEATWVRRFATEAFLADNTLQWKAAVTLAERFWPQLSTIEPEKVARTYVEGQRASTRTRPATDAECASC